MTTPHPEFIEAKLAAVGRELDTLCANGRQLSRRMIIDLAYRRGFQDGVDFEAKDWTTQMNATLQSAAIPSARKQLEPLRVKDTGQSTLKAKAKVRGGVDTSAFQKALNDSFSHIASTGMWATPLSFWDNGSGAVTGLKWNLLKAQPSISDDLLTALKTAEPYKPVAAPQVPDMVECLTGWRGWTLSKSGKLEALGQSTEWPVKHELVAICEASGRHLAPDWNCSCGIWAFKDVDKLVAAIGGRYNSVRVIGAVSLWGKVIETENGYRAERAYPKELWLLDSALEYLGTIYDIPVRSIK